MIKAILIFLLLGSTVMAENKISQIINLRKQARPKTTSKAEKKRLYPKIWKLMQQLSQVEWEHPIIKDLNKFFTTTTGGKWYAKQAERPVRRRVSGHRGEDVHRGEDAKEYKRKSKQIESDVLSYLAKKGHLSGPGVGPGGVGEDKLPSMKKGKGFVTSKHRPHARAEGHRKWGAIDIQASKIGDRKAQQKFIEWALNKGYTVIDETKAISQKRKTATRGVFHLDKRPGKPRLIQEVPQGGRFNRLGYWEGPDIGKYTTVPIGQISEGGFTAPRVHYKEEKEETTVETSPRINVSPTAEKFKIPSDTSKIASWMKKYGWKASDLGKYVNGKWKGLHPGDVIEEKEQITGTAEEVVTDKELKNFPDGSTTPKDNQNKVPESIVTSEDIQKTEGKVGIPFGMEESGMEEWEGKVSPGAEHRGGLGGFRAEGDPTRERIEEQISLREKAYELSPEAKASAEDAKRLKVLEESTVIEDEPTDHFPGSPIRQKLKDGGEIKKYKTGELVEKDKVETDKVETEFYPGQEQQFQQNIGQEFTKQGKTQAGDKPLMLSELEQSETIDQPKPKPPREPMLTKEGVVMVKQQETGDTDKMSVEEVKKRIEDTKEVVSDERSDTVTVKTRPTQRKRNKELRQALHKKQLESDPRFGSQEEFEAYKKVSEAPSPQLDEETLTEKITVEDKEADPKAFSIQDYIQQTLQRDDEARKIMQDELAKANEVEQNLQKVEPFRFWNNMSTPAKIVAGIGMLIGGYAAKDSPAGLQAVMNVIDGAVTADINAQKLTRSQQISTAKEATRRAQAAVNKYKALATNPATKAKLLELGQALEMKKVGLEKTKQLQALRSYVMNEARAGRLHLVPPALMRMVYPKEEMKRIDTMRTNFEKERKERKIAPIISAYRRLHNLMSTKEEISGADDIAIVFQFMKMLDPNSVVREGEFKTAEGAGPRAKFFARQWNRMFYGGRFTQDDRKDFLRSSLKLVKPAMDEEKELQRKYISMARRYGFPSAFIVSPATRYFDLPGTMDDAAVRKIMKEQGKTREEAESIHFHVAGKVKKPRNMYRKGVKYTVRE